MNPASTSRGDQTASPAALELARRLLANHAAPTSDGLMHVDLSVREIAIAHSRSPSTIQSYLRELDHAGIRVDSEQRLYDPTALPITATSRAEPQPRANSPPDAAAALGALVELVTAMPHEVDTAVSVATRVLRRVAANPIERANSMAREVARPATLSRRDKQADSSGNLRDSMRDSVADKFINQFIAVNDDSVDHSRRDQSRAQTRAPRASTNRSPADLHDLLAALTAACKRHKFPAITNTDGLLARLDPYSDAQIRYAIAKLLIEIRTGTLAQPVGKLANLATDGSTDYLPTDPAPVRLPGDPVPGEAPDSASPKPEAIGDTEGRYDPTAMIDDSRRALRGY